MVIPYPSLSEQQQEGLPALVKPASLFEAKFEDSTHQLWYCETVDGPMVLKLCNQDTVAQSVFWQGMNGLFTTDFPASLADIDKLYHFVGDHGLLAAPEYIASQASVFVLARYLEGDDVIPTHISNMMVARLAHHIAQFHQQRRVGWGAFHQTAFSAEQWSSRLQSTLVALVELHPTAIPDTILEQALQQASTIKHTAFSPIMMDLRWDQMLHQQGELSAVVDMDAFVIGPRELELVLLEYQLNSTQADLFKQAYQYSAELPDLSEQRYCYRLLLFLMNSLGESDINQWMNAPTRW